MSKTGTLAKIGAVLAAPIPDVELLIPALVANPAPGIKFVLGILRKGGKRVSEVQSVLFDKAQWAVSDAKKWLKQQGFRIPTADETTNFFRFRQKSPSRYKEMRTIEAGQHRNPSGSGNFWVVLLEHDGKQWHVEQRYQFPTLSEASEWVRGVLKNNPDFGFVLAERIAGLPNRILRTWNVPRETAKRIVTIAKAETVNPSESIPESLTGHLALTSDPFFQQQPPEIQAAAKGLRDVRDAQRRRVGQGAAVGACDGFCLHGVPSFPGPRRRTTKNPLRPSAVVGG